MIDHKEILELFEYAHNDEYDQRDLAGKDCVALEEQDGMWSERAKDQRKSRPRLTVDLISPGIDQATGDQREMSSEAQVIPLADATKDMAQIFSGLLRSINNDCDFLDTVDAAYSEQLMSGYGGWRNLTRECPTYPWKQDIYSKWVPSAHSSLYFDPSADDYDRSDADWGFVITTTTDKAFKREWPKQDAPGFFRRAANIVNSTVGLWYPSNRVQIGEFWWKDKKKKKLARLYDSVRDRVITIDMEAEKDVLDELFQMGYKIRNEQEDIKEIDGFDIKTVKLTGLDFLNDWEDWAGSYIPLVPVYGKTAIIDGKKYYRGLTRKALDSNRMVNYAFSTISEVIALSPKDPYWHTPEQSKGHEPKWARFGVDNNPMMPYNHDPNEPGPPKRSGAPSVPQALLGLLQQSIEFVRATMGINDASLGLFDKRISEQAIESQQMAGDRGVYIFPSNLMKSLRHDAKIKIDLIQKTWDTERIEKILNEDGTTEDVTLNLAKYNEINEPVLDRQTGKQVIVNDVSKGTYGVKIITGPASATRRMQTLQQLKDLISSNNKVSDLLAVGALDIIIGNMDINNAEELKKRARRYMIQQGIVDPTDEEKEEFGLNEEPPPDPMQLALIENVRIQTEKLVEEIRNTQADTQKKLYDTHNDAIKSLETLIKTLSEKVKSGAPITEQDAEMVAGEVAIVQDSQIDTLKTNELGGSKSIEMKEVEGEIQGTEGPEGPRGPQPAPQLPDGFEQ